MELSREPLVRADIPEKNKHKIFAYCTKCGCCQLNSTGKCIFCSSYNLSYLYKKSVYETIRASAIAFLIVILLFIPAFLFCASNIVSIIIFFTCFFIAIAVAITWIVFFHKTDTANRFEKKIVSKKTFVNGRNMFENTMDQIEKRFDLIFFDDRNDREEDKKHLRELNIQLQNVMEFCDSEYLRDCYKMIFNNKSFTDSLTDYIDLKKLRYNVSDGLEYSYYLILVKYLSKSPQILDDEEYFYLAKYCEEFFCRFVKGRNNPYLNKIFGEGLVCIYYSLYYKKAKTSSVELSKYKYNKFLFIIEYFYSKDADILINTFASAEYQQIRNMMRAAEM